MSKFAVTTYAAVAAALLALLLLDGDARAWTIAVLVVSWISLTVFGVSYISWGFFTPALCRGNEAEAQVALTFDDGPDANVTPAVLDELRRLGIKAAFFCVGERVRKFPEIVKRIVDEGHIVANHSDRHRWWTNFLFTAALGNEIACAQEAIRKATGRRPRFFRPPMGLTNPHLAAALKTHGMLMVGWDTKTFDKGSTAARIVRRVLGNVRPGGIILMHDAGIDPDSQVDALACMVGALREKGLEFTRLDRLLGEDAWQEAPGK